MSIAEMQACLARLYVDEAFMRLFKLEPSAIAEHYDLTQEEQSAILGIDRERLTMFAASLKAKKKGRFSGTFPLSFLAAPQIMDRCTHRYFQVRGISQGDLQLDLILDFGRFVEETLAGNGDAPFYMRDLVYYEKLLAGCKLSPLRPASESEDGTPEDLSSPPSVIGYVRLGHFSCDIEEVCRLLRREAEMLSVRRGDFHIAFRPAVPWGRARTFQLTGPTRRLMDLCDGTRTVGQLIEELKRTYGDVVQTAAPAMITKLSGLGLLEGGRQA